MNALRAGSLIAQRYRLVGQIGTGGMSVVWRAHDETLDRTVAVKVLAPALAAEARFRTLVRDEARAAARLDHPHVTAVHDYGETTTAGGDVTAYVVMELLDGEELHSRLGDGPLPWADGVRVCAEVAEALAAAHDLGVVHRDVTPANVMLTDKGAKVLDFGIAARVGARRPDGDGESFGTPAYAAPERLDGGAAQASTDVYSLGVLLFETLTGRVPFPAETWDDLSRTVAAGTAPPPALAEVPGLPPAVIDVCLSCLARDPAQRPTARQVGEVLRAQLAPVARTASAIGPVGTTAATATQVLTRRPKAPPTTGARHRLAETATGPGIRPLGQRLRAVPPRVAVPVAVAAVVLVAAVLGVSLSGGDEPVVEGIEQPSEPATVLPVDPVAPLPEPTLPARSTPTRAPTRTPSSAPATTSSPATRSVRPSLRAPGRPFKSTLSRLDRLVDRGMSSGDISSPVGFRLQALAGALQGGGGIVDSQILLQMRRTISTGVQSGQISRAYEGQLNDAMDDLESSLF
jgi:serine/threonine-protein kinase